MRTMLRLATFVFAVLIATSSLQGQVATGTYPYGTYDSPGIDTINVGNLNVHFAIPVLNKTGRGTPFTYALSYDSSVWMPETVSGVLQWQPINNWGWRGATEMTTGYISDNLIQVVCHSSLVGRIEVPDGWRWTASNVVYHDPWGASHPFQGSQWFQSVNCGSPTSGGTVGPVTSDGSGYQYVPTGTGLAAQIENKKGTILAAPVNVGTGSATVTDSNGNEISVNSSGQFTDTTGNTVLTVSGSSPSPETFSYTDTSGHSQTVTMTYATYTVQTAFHCSAVSDFGPTSEPLVSSISFPDGSIYSFSYEPTPGASGNVTGRLAGIQLPQGGWIDYAYSGGNNGIECSDGSTAGLARTLASNAGSSASTWTYTRTTGTGTSQTAVVDGLSNNKGYTFVEASNQPAGTIAEYYETSRKIYQGAATGTPVIARNTCYNGAASPCATTIPTVPFSQIDTYETLNGLQTDGSTAKFNSNGMQTEADAYDFASGTASRGSLLRKEVWTYGYSIPGLPTQDEVFDGSGTEASKTTYSYDGTTPTASSGVPQHVAATGSRGNLTGKTLYASSSTSYALNATYEDTGSLLTGTVPTGTTTHSYDSTFVYQTGVQLPTPSSGVSVAFSNTYDTTNTGMPLSASDPNGQITVYSSYDSMLRLTETSFPDGGESTFSYSPTQLGQHVYQSSTVYSDTETQLDGYGRKSRLEIANGQSSNPWYQTDTCYDGNGNASFSSYRYQGSGFSGGKVCSGSGDVTSYDVLGRITEVVRANGETRNYSYSGRATKSTDENGVTRISQIDGLGRPITSCEISSNSTMPGSGSPVSCGTDIAGTGFITSYSYALATGITTTTQGAQTRTFQSDWLGRPILVQEPESGQTTYTYAYNSTGLVVTRSRPKANQTSSTVLTTTTKQLDALGRDLTITYNDGTPTKSFAYDTAAGVSTGTGAHFTDLTQANLIGRRSMAAVSTAATAYSYDAMGRTSYLDECLPSGPCGTVAYNRQVHYIYDLAGIATSSTDGAGVTTTYTVSPASELLSLTSSLSNSTNPPDIVSNLQNGPNGPNSYSLGNGLSGVFGYDTLGRLNGGWVCNGSASLSCTGGTQVYGFTNGWSGTQLQGLSDSVLGQTSTYGYDEFNRLTSRTVTSGTVQNYTWGYDRWGNRWSQTPLSGGLTSSLSFNTSTNQISTSGFTYDAAGNMTSDNFHTYTYDAEGNITAVDSGTTASYVYNAINQRARAVVGSTATESIFNLSGQRVSEWNGTTRAQLQGKYYWGENPVAFYTNTSGAVHFEHQDWMGTERLRTTYNGGVEGTFTSLPFGDGLTTASGTDLDPYHYAQYDHDYETDTDHAESRQYSNEQGRWHAPDSNPGSHDFSNPQSMHRYSYATPWGRLGRIKSFSPLSIEGPYPIDCDPLEVFCSNPCNDPFNPTCCDGDNGWCQPEPSHGGGGGGGGGNDDAYFVANCKGGGLFLTKFGCPYICGAVEVGGFPPVWITIGAIDFSAKQIYEGCPPGLSEVFCPSDVVVAGNVDEITGKPSNMKILSCYNGLLPEPLKMVSSYNH
jgi:YD repeat-containing protein